MSTREEWLVVPLLLVVVAAAIGGHLFLRSAHERELDRYREHGRAELAQWLGDEGQARGYPEEWTTRATAPLRTTHETLGQRAAPLVAILEGTAYSVLGEFDSAPWQFAATYPAGLSASALSNSEVRMALEGGAAPSATDHVDEATRELIALAATPDLNRLRKALLPIGTKQFLLRRWAASVVDSVPESEYRRRLLALDWVFDAVQRVHASTFSRTSLGYHLVDDLVVRVTADEGPLQIAPRHVANWVFPTRRNVARARGNHGIVLSFHASPPTERLGLSAMIRHPKYGSAFEKSLLDAVHRGSSDSLTPRRETWLWHETITAGPLAGTWTFRWDFGPNWWDSPRYGNRLSIGITGLLIMLGGILLLWFGMRKQRKLNEARARFVNELAHDLRTPLTSLRLHTEMLESGRAPEARRGHYLGLIGREASRLSALLANLLDLSRLDGARAPLHLSPVSLASAADDAVRAFALVHPDRANDVQVEGPSDAHVRADPAALARVLGNLLENAGKFTKPGTAIRVTWEPFASKWALRVADDGPGISSEERRAVFRRYGRGTKAKSDGIAGSGLGLALVRELAERMKGSVRLLPTTTGATFEIRLPREAHA